MVNLIFDRKNEDVARLKTLRTKVRNRTATVKEYEEWLTSLKGAYNNTDFNRVGEAINYLANLLNTYGYKNNAKARTDWDISEKPNTEQTKEYLKNLQKIRDAYIQYSSTPNLPNDMEKLTFLEANDIEKILNDINEIIKDMTLNFIYCGVSKCGQSRIWQKRFREIPKWLSLEGTIQEKSNVKWEEVINNSKWVGNSKVEMNDSISGSLNYWNYFMSDIDTKAGDIYGDN